ncbi:MAG: chromosomal replication initiator protein DnaA [bacterium]
MDAVKIRYTFENFVVGLSNQFAHAAAMAVANQPGTAYNPLFIYGGVGLGKTHLLHAIHAQIAKNWPHLVQVYLSAETFINELINAIRYEKIGEFQSKYRSMDVLLLDDVQFMAGKERTQEEFFHVFNSFYESQKQIVLTSDKIPKDIPELEERLRSRFEWGLIADIQPPDMETRVAILNKKAESEGIPLPSDVSLFLASHVHSNVRILEGSLMRLKAYSNMSNLAISIEMCRSLLKDILEEQQTFTSTEDIIKAVSRFYKVKPSDIKSQKRAKDIAMARQVAMYLCRKLTSESFPEIGTHFGGKDHSTVIHAVNKIEHVLRTDANLQKEIQLIRRSLS